MMTLGELLRQLCAKTTLDTYALRGLNAVPLPSSPDCLKDSTDFCRLIWIVTFQAALPNGTCPIMARAFLGMAG
jgi:hypothetical protein